MLAPPSSSEGKKILEASASAFLRAKIAFLLASTRPSSTKILFVKSLTTPSSLKWIFESSVLDSVGASVLLTKIASVSISSVDSDEEDSNVVASVVVAASVVVVDVVGGVVVEVVVVVVVVLMVMGSLGRMVEVCTDSSVARGSASVVVTSSLLTETSSSPSATSSGLPEPKMVLTASKISS